MSIYGLSFFSVGNAHPITGMFYALLGPSQMWMRTKRMQLLPELNSTLELVLHLRDCRVFNCSVCVLICQINSSVTVRTFYNIFIINNSTRPTFELV